LASDNVDRRRTAKVQTRSDKFFESLEATAQKLLPAMVGVDVKTQVMLAITY
jgi:hypothetical protein